MFGRSNQLDPAVVGSRGRLFGGRLKLRPRISDKLVDDPLTRPKLSCPRRQRAGRRRMLAGGLLGMPHELRGLIWISPSDQS